MTRSDQPSADAQFEAIHNGEWHWRRRQLTPDEDSPPFLAPRLPDIGEAQQQYKLGYWRNVREQLDMVDARGLSPQRAVDYRVYRFQIEALLADQKFKTWQCPISGDTAFWSDILYIARPPRHTEAEYRDYLGLLGEIPRYFAQNIANLRAGLARGFTPPRITLQGRDAGVAHILGIVLVVENPFFAPFLAMPDAIPEERRNTLRAEAADLIQRKIRPAYAELLRFLWDEYIPRAQTSIAARDLPDGEAFYCAQIVKYTTRAARPEALHALGLTEVERLRAEMNKAMAETGFSRGLPAFLEFLRCDPQFIASDAHALLDRAMHIAAKIENRIPAYFGRLPRQRYVIQPVPAELAPFFTAGRGGLGYFLVNTYDLPSRPLYSLPALTAHEAAPGHAFQMALSTENEGLPAFRRETPLAAYSEGWAVYCERLCEEMGLYETPYERFGMLSYQIWRAARLVVDTGIHALGWPREKAQQFLRDTTALPDHEIVTEVDRYIAWPGQALSYFVGAMCFSEGRRRAERSLGRRFDLRAFHDWVLGLGPVPLDVLDVAIDKFIAENGIEMLGDR